MKTMHRVVNIFLNNYSKVATNKAHARKKKCPTFVPNTTKNTQNKEQQHKTMSQRTVDSSRIMRKCRNPRRIMSKSKAYRKMRTFVNRL